MDYEALAAELLQRMFALGNERPHMDIAESLRGEMIALHFIERRGCPVKPSEISRGIRRTTARVAAALNSLEKKGLVTREIDENDRRRILVKITPAGRDMVEERHRDIIRIATTLLSMLGEEDAREYVRITGRLAEFAAQKAEKCKQK